MGEGVAVMRNVSWFLALLMFPVAAWALEGPVCVSSSASSIVLEEDRDPQPWIHPVTTDAQSAFVYTDALPDRPVFVRISFDVIPVLNNTTFKLQAVLMPGGRDVGMPPIFTFPAVALPEEGSEIPSIGGSCTYRLAESPDDLDHTKLLLMVSGDVTMSYRVELLSDGIPGAREMGRFESRELARRFNALGILFGNRS